MAKFNYEQTFPKRTLTGSALEQFVWPLFSIDTEYKEPFGHVNLTSSSGQGYVPDQAVRPVRLFNLTFKGMILYGDDYLKKPQRTNFNSLYDFYKRHGTHKQFIFPHPVYGDLVVRFGKPLSLPKKNVNGLGSLQSFDIILIESITTHYIFTDSEDYSGDLPFHAEFFDVEVDTAEDTLVAPLGNNYEMIFKYARKPLRTFKVTVQGMKYFEDPDGSLNPYLYPDRNMLLLELFYMKYRLRDRFIFSYLGEDVPVRFAEPIKISKVEGNTGVIGNIDLTFIETPNKLITELNDLGVK